MQVAVIVLNWNGKKDTLECLHSLERLDYSNYQVIVVDNGSTDDSCQAISDTFPNTCLIQNEKNLGYAEGNNVGIRYAIEKNFDAILILNNDTTVSPDLISKFVEDSSKNPQAILGAKIYQYSKRDTFDHLGGMWDKDLGQFKLIGEGFKDDNFTFENNTPLDYVCGASIFAQTHFFKNVGVFDPRFFLFWEEADLCFRGRRKGYNVLLCPKAKIYHKVSASFTGGKPHVAYFWWRNKLLWVDKNIESKTEKKTIRKNTLSEFIKSLKLIFLLSLQLLIKKATNRDTKSKKREILYRKAIITAYIHYKKKRFFEGPRWLFTPPS